MTHHFQYQSRNQSFYAQQSSLGISCASTRIQELESQFGGFRRCYSERDFSVFCLGEAIEDADIKIRFVDIKRIQPSAHGIEIVLDNGTRLTNVDCSYKEFERFRGALKELSQ